MARQERLETMLVGSVLLGLLYAALLLLLR